MLFKKTFWTEEEGGKEKKKGKKKSTVGLKIAQVGGYPALHMVYLSCGLVQVT